MTANTSYESEGNNDMSTFEEAVVQSVVDETSRTFISYQ